jgi:hypothetical protein
MILLLIGTEKMKNKFENSDNCQTARFQPSIFITNSNINIHSKIVALELLINGLKME